MVASWPVIAIALGACGGERIPPKQLVDARAEMGRAKSGEAARLDPTDVHEAELALQRAEQALADDPDDPNALDLATIAQLKSQLAQAEAASLRGQQEIEQARRDREAALAAQLQAAKGTLDKTQQALAQKDTELQRTAAEAAAQKQQLLELETKLKDARDTIAKIAAVKDDDRGMVITLSGEVLFQTGKWALKAGAMAKLDQIAEALRGKEQPMVVYGFTDDIGTRDSNMVLSEKRADSVREYLVSKGIPKDLITAQGKGPDSPISDNNSVEGRASNRRVEIVVQPKKS
jgi:outer membrane protein OmpA-like peptidoglycan-associated protein